MTGWDLSNFSRALERDAARTREKENEAIAKAKTGLPEAIMNLKSLTDEDLLNHFLHHANHANSGWTSRREFRVIHRLMKIHTRKEILRRMTKKIHFQVKR